MTDKTKNDIEKQAAITEDQAADTEPLNEEELAEVKGGYGGYYDDPPENSWAGSRRRQEREGPVHR